MPPRIDLTAQAMDLRQAAAEASELASSGLFDAPWYQQAYLETGPTSLEPALQFVLRGWQERQWPNAWFNPDWYLTSYPDVSAAGMNPLLHYLRHGDLEGRRPMAYFDPRWYRSAYQLAPDRLALRHFLARRATGLYAPCASLYAVASLPPYRDDPAHGQDPFRHYLDDMARDRKEVFPDFPLVAGSGLVDANYYLINGSDVQAARLEPALHFCRFGWKEQRKPNIYFDTAWYIATNPRVAQLGLDPLVHYICEGEAANRRPVPYFDPGWYRATYGIAQSEGALAHYLMRRRSQKFSPTPLFDVAWYVARHSEELGPNRDPFAHFLQAGMHDDRDPSPEFDAAAYRRRHLGRPSRGFRNRMHAESDNPLIHHLRSEYR